MSVHFSSPTNSTHFTDCCDKAVCMDEYRCPSCFKEIPESYRERDEIARRRFYGGEGLRELRQGYRKF